ncbi:hypothetical protein LRS13_22970 [Svornostia abyssi]|uniref:Uncharacterized protein n=1 Tax=Svornostia abyssi TaxID=2898438 RepID=A0ABY5PFY6_9ACTN|nr:hypothetical protein LRS13_22970 [Parviterribacteraceae bacterium J379]
MSFSRALGAAAAALMLAGVFPATGQAVLTTPEVLLLDTYDTRAFRGFAGPVQTTQPLAPGGFYIVTARGTFSRHLKSLMTAPAPDPYTLCGTPKPAPLDPSPGRPDSPAGQDPEYVFAYPIEDKNKKKGYAKICAASPGTLAAFEIDTGLGFSRRPSYDKGTAPRPDHTYSYRIEGANLPASFRYTDSNLADNTGVMTITITPANTTTCGDDPRCLASLASGATPTATPAAGSGAAATNVILPTRSCASRRLFRITLRDRKADPIVAATVRLNGKTVKVLRARVGGRTRRISTVDLRGLPGNRFTVSITAKTRSGKVLRGSRKYFTCKPKLKSGPPKL